MMKMTLISAAAIAVALASQASATTQIGDVFYIDLENHNATQPSTYTSTGAIYGSPAAPFINSLITPGNPNAAEVSYATHYNNVEVNGATVHPSEPNYVWQESGSAANNGSPTNLGSDAEPYSNKLANNTYANISTNPNLSGLLQAKGISWKSYQEDIDLAGSNGLNFSNAANRTAGVTLTDTGLPTSADVVPLSGYSGTSASYTNAYNGSHQYNFAPKHDGQLFFQDTNGGNNSGPSNTEASHYSPLQALSTDLANNTVGAYNLITPDQYNDMHTALSGGFTYNGVHYTGDAAQIAQGDNFLSKIVPLIEASQAFQNNGEIVIWNDEDEGDSGSTDSQFSGVEIVISPLAKGNAYTNGVSYNHSSDVLTLQEIFQAGTGTGNNLLGGAAGATNLSDLYKSGAVPTGVPEPATWAFMIIGIGAMGQVLRRRRQAAAA